MSARIGRTALTYLAMVGAPAIGLVWVLHAGASLAAPPVVAGAWAVTADAQLASCFGVGSGARMSIEQSGRYLRVHIGESAAEARLSDGRVHLELAAPGGSCHGRRVALSGVIEEGDAMTWHVRAPACGACPDARFDARRPTE